MKNLPLMKNLPFWHLTNKYPSFQDVDSKTAVEMVAKVYGTMQELITEFNNLSSQLEKSMTDFETGVNNDVDEFKRCITEIVENFIKVVDDKLFFQDKKIENVVEDAINSGKIKAVGIYDETSESLEITITYDGGNE